jgi:hypothetical protein
VPVPVPVASAQEPSGAPWPVVTAAITPPDVPTARGRAGTAATAVPLAPVSEDPNVVAAGDRRSPWGYVVVGALGAIGATMYGWSAWRRLRKAP